MLPFRTHRRVACASLLVLVLTAAAHAATTQPAFWAWAQTPPMGWNSYDSFGDSVTEEEVLANAQYMKEHLLKHGWNYVVVDYQDTSPDWKRGWRPRRLDGRRVSRFLTRVGQ